MHELSIAESILDGIRATLADRPGARPVRVGVRIGRLAAVDPDSLDFCFQSVIAGTDWQSLSLDLQTVEPRRRCRACQRTFLVIDYDPACLHCSNLDTEAISGDELDFAYLEIETDGSPAPQVESAR